MLKSSYPKTKEKGADRIITILNVFRGLLFGKNSVIRAICTRGIAVAKIFGCFSDEACDVARLELHLRKSGDRFKKISTDKGIILLSWNQNDFSKIINEKDLILIFEGFDCSLYSSQNVAETYRKEGDRFFSRLNGQTKAIILDLKRNTVKLVSDPFGLNFLYVMIKDGVFAFSSEMKLLLFYDPSLGKNINKCGLAEYALFHYTLGNKTVFQNISLLDSASTLKLDLNSFDYEIKKYLLFPSNYSKLTNYPKALRKVKDLLVKSVNKRTFKGAKLTLSGGLDTRVLLASVNPSMRKNLTSINFGNLQCDDVRFARLIAQKFAIGYNFHHVTAKMVANNMERFVWITEGGASQVSFLLQVMAKESPTAVLDGYLGDAVLGGSYVDRFLDAKVLSVENCLRKLAMPERIQKLVFTTKFYNEIQKCLIKSAKMEGERYSDVKNAVLKIEYAMMNNRGRRYINYGPIATGNYCPDLKPFFDKDLFEFYIRIPYYYRTRHKFYFDLIRREYTGLLSIPSTRINSNLRKLVAYAKKALEKAVPADLFEENTYIPLNTWLRDNEEYRTKILRILLSPRTIQRGFFSREGIMKLLDEHDRRRGNHAVVFHSLADFELFNRLFIDGDWFDPFCGNNGTPKNILRRQPDLE